MTGKLVVGWRGILGFVMFAAIFGLLLAAGQTGDWILRAAIWLAIVILSAALLYQRFGPHRKSPGRETLLQRWHRWAMDDSDPGRG
jgi:hypothetical protein